MTRRRWDALLPIVHAELRRLAQLTISGLAAEDASQDLDVLWLHEAVEKLEALDARQARVSARGRAR